MHSTQSQTYCLSTWPSSCTSSYTPGSGGGQESPCSEFSGFRGGYTQQHGDVVGWGQPRPAVRHQDGSSHIGRGPAGQEKSTVGHLCLVSCSLQRNGLERTGSLPSGTAWGITRSHTVILHIPGFQQFLSIVHSDELHCTRTLNKAPSRDTTDPGCAF